MRMPQKVEKKFLKDPLPQQNLPTAAIKHKMAFKTWAKADIETTGGKTLAQTTTM